MKLKAAVTIFTAGGVFSLAPLALQQTRQAIPATQEATRSLGIAAVPSGLMVLGDSPNAPNGFSWTGKTLLATHGSLWTQGPSMNALRTGPAAAELGGKLYAVSGRHQALGTLEEFDPVTGIWSVRAEMNVKRTRLAAVGAAGRVYAIGGQLSDLSASSVVEAYDPITNAWQLLAPMSTARSSLAAVEMGGFIYVIGGVSDGSVERYDLVKNEWSPVASMNTLRLNSAAAASAGKLYAIGGDGAELVEFIEEYDPSTDSWTTGPRLPYLPRCRAASIGNRIYVFDRYRVYEYDASQGSWTYHSPMQHDFSFIKSNDVDFAVVAAGSTVYAMGGTTVPNSRFVSAFTPGVRLYVHESN